MLHTAADMSVVEVELGEEAQLELTELFTAEAFAEVSVRQAARSRCRLTTVLLSSANASYRIDLDGADAENELSGVFLAAGEEHCVLKLHTAHNVADCRSDSYVKGVAGGQAVGEFCGMVYVAPDAQRTDARQQSRNILLSRTARITTQPQLEIYADDVKCSHGATVGQMDSSSAEMRKCLLSLPTMPLLHFPGACTCFMGIFKAINSYKNHAMLIYPSSSGTTTISPSSANEEPNFTFSLSEVETGNSISSKQRSHGTMTKPSV